MKPSMRDLMPDELGLGLILISLAIVDGSEFLDCSPY
jgi:hypothetical protein